MRDCIYIDANLEHETAEEAYERCYKRAKHLITEHRVNGFYIPSRIMRFDIYDHLMLALYELRFEYDIYIVVFSRTKKECEEAKKYYLGLEIPEIDFEVQDFLEVYTSCQYKFTPTPYDQKNPHILYID